MLVVARYVMPRPGEVIEGGAVWIEKGQVCEIHTPSRLADGPSNKDLGEVVVLPGLINAHCHLELTELGGKVPSGGGFTAWLQRLVAIKKSWQAADYERSARAGIEMVLRSGTTTVCDVVSWWPLTDLLHSAPLRCWTCLEMIDFNGSRSWRDWIEWAADRVERHGVSRGGWGLSPHAPYTATAELYRACARWLQTGPAGAILATHLCESSDEREMFEEGGGPLYEWLAHLGRDMYDCGGQPVLLALSRMGLLGPRLMGIHLNGLDEEEMDLVARAGMSVVHCPGSHAFFSHPPFPLEQLLARGVNVCVGTDSLASAPAGASLDLFAELRQLRRTHPGLPPHQILAMATTHPARALQAEGRLGTLAPGACADLIALRLPSGVNERDLCEAVVSGGLPVVWGMVGGVPWKEEP